MFCIGPSLSMDLYCHKLFQSDHFISTTHLPFSILRLAHSFLSFVATYITALLVSCLAGRSPFHVLIGSVPLVFWRCSVFAVPTLQSSSHHLYRDRTTLGDPRTDFTVRSFRNPFRNNILNDHEQQWTKW